MKKITIGEIYLNILMGETINWCEISQKYKFDDDFIDEFANKLDWYFLCKYHKLNESIIDKYIDKVDWVILTIYQKLNPNMIEKYKNKIYWFWLIVNNDFNEDFLWKYCEYTKDYIEEIRRHQTVSNEFIEKLQDYGS